MAPFATNCNGNMCVYFVNRVRSSLDKIELDNENLEILIEIDRLSILRSFESKVIDHGPVLDFTINAFMLPQPGPDGDLLLLTDHEQTLRIIEVVE